MSCMDSASRQGVIRNASATQADVAREHESCAELGGPEQQFGENIL